MLKKILVLLVIIGIAFALMLVIAGDSQFEVQSDARLPVSPEEAWSILAAVDSWPDWWPGMEEARLVGVLRAGSEIQLRLKGMPGSDLALLTLVRPPIEIVWEGAGVFGSRAGTRFLLEGDADGSRLTMQNYVLGPQAVLARLTGEEAFARYQQLLLERLGLSVSGKHPVVGEKD